MSAASWWGGLDVGGIVCFEHLNLEVPDILIAKTFYMEGMGFSLDPFSTAPARLIWYNVGYQQFHVGWRPDKQPQVIDGHIGIIVPDLDLLLKRLKKVSHLLKDTKFKFEIVKQDEKASYLPIPIKGLSYVEVTCPWGNVFHVYENNEEIDFRGGLGMAYVQFNCPINSVDDISEFYKHNLGALTVVEKSEHGNLVRVLAGLKQQIIYVEKENVPTEKDWGYHFAIYISDFSGTYKKVREQKLENNLPPDTFEIALKDRQFRFDKIQWNGKLIAILEHEVKSMHHFNYMRPLTNLHSSESIFKFQ